MPRPEPASRRASRLYELGAGLSFVDRLRAPYQIAYADKMDVVVRDLRSGRTRTLFTDRERHVSCPLAWSPDGKTVFHAYDQLLAIDVRSRAVREVTSFRDGDRFRIVWRLQISPDGRRAVFLHHAEAGRWHIVAVGVDGAGLRRVDVLGNVWSFACDWERSVLVAQTALGTSTIVRLDLESGETLSVTGGDLGLRLGLMGDGLHAVYEESDSVWLRRVDEEAPAELLARGRAPSVSPDGSTIAFMRGEDEVYVQSRHGGEAKLLLRAHVPPADKERRTGSYRIPPLWSPDGKYLCVWSTIATRHDEPRNPEWVASLRLRQEEYERERRSGTPRDPKKPFPHFEASIEDAHWEFEHSTGIVDLQAGTVWLTRGYWQDAAWSPRLHER